VLAATVRGKAELIVTVKHQGLPRFGPGRYGLSAVHPDDFLLDQLHLEGDGSGPDAVL
jgi:hypothetical protein